MRLADDIDGLALSAGDPGQQSIVMAVDQLRRVANGLRLGSRSARHDWRRRWRATCRFRQVNAGQ